jgi:hypothetical protein
VNGEVVRVLGGPWKRHGLKYPTSHLRKGKKIGKDS